MPKKLDVNKLIGNKYGRWTIIRLSSKNKYGAIRVLCLCDCGTEKQVVVNSLLYGSSRSCGCLHNELLSAGNTTHSLTNDKLYIVYHGIKGRCYNKKHRSFNIYGGRGIVICDEWLSDFQKFYDWSIANGYVDGLQVDRIDNDKGYFPDNCRFVTASNNCQNTRLIRENNRSGYRGVCFSKNTYIAQIQTRGIRIYKEGFNTAKDAALYRDKCVIEHGINSPLNFPEMAV